MGPAKNRTNVDEAFECLVREILKLREAPSQTDDPSAPPVAKKKKKNACVLF